MATAAPKAIKVPASNKRFFTGYIWALQALKQGAVSLWGAMTNTATPTLTLYNSLTRTKEPFKPQDPNRVTMYNCGPTVYSYAHIGNARAAVVADVLFRVLRHIYGEDHVVYARNITDVDDKIIASAKEQNKPISEITGKYAQIYNEDLAAIGCLEPTYQPKATDAISEMQDIIVELMDKDIAYFAEGHVLFDVTKMEEYGKLSGRKLDDNLAGARVEVAGYKRNAGDFVLWKPAKDDEPGWDFKNYGRGRPGWHIECSAMIRQVLGETIDIHCGGIDLKFPHHENEIAQSECANEKPLANVWVHNEFLNMGSDKMSKSLGNVKLIRDLLKDWDGEVIRLALLKAHYRSELVWSEDLLKESKAQLDRWYRAKSILYSGKPMPKVVEQQFNEVMLDFKAQEILSEEIKNDLSIPEITKYLSAIAQEIFDSKDQINSINFDPIHEEYFVLQRASVLIFETNLLGLLQKDPEEWFRPEHLRVEAEAGISERDTAKAEVLAAKAAGDKALMGQHFKRSDEIRDSLKDRGIILEDKPDGTTGWRKA